MNDNRWIGTPILPETALKLYTELCRVYGKKRTMLVIEVMPKSVMKTIDNEQDAEITIENLAQEVGKK